MTHFTILDYLTILIALLLFAVGVIFSLKQPQKNIRISMIISFFFLAFMLAFLSIIILDKYTKKAKIFNLRNHRVLSLEQIVYTGIVKNVGSYEIGRVKLTIKLANDTSSHSSEKPVSFYKTNSFLSFFHPKQERSDFISHTFTIAKDLKPGGVRVFRVSFAFPPYFTRTSQYTELSAH